MVILQQGVVTPVITQTQMPSVAGLLLGAGLAVIGGFFGVIIRVRVERKEEINFIKICLTDELDGICSIIASMKDTFSKSPIIYPVDLNKLRENTTNFNDHRKRIYLINDEKLRKDIFDFYKEITKSILDSSRSISLSATPQDHQKILTKMEELSKRASTINSTLKKYKYKALLVI